MASYTNSAFTFFLLLTTLVSSLQTHARDAQFFSKVSRRNPGDTTTYPNYDYHNHHQQNLPTPFPKQLQYEEDQPDFLPQTTNAGSNGLYGQETALDNNPASSSSSSSLYDDKYDQYQNNVKNNYQNFEKNQFEGLSETSYTNNDNNGGGLGKYMSENNNNNNNNNNRYYGGVEKQGMSDTRFLENGKYFHDISSDKEFKPNNNNNNDISYNNAQFYGNNDSKFGEDEFEFDDQP